jgi:hypothetical protein
VIALPGTYTPSQSLFEDTHRGVLAAVRRELPRVPEPYLIDCIGRSAVDFCGTLTLALETDGIRTKQNRHGTFLYGPDLRWRLAGPHQVLPSLLVYSGPDVVRPIPGARLVAESPSSKQDQADVEAGIAALSQRPVVVRPRDVARLQSARFERLVPRLVLKTSADWFRGETAAQWNDLIRSDPTRFVEGGGLPVLAGAGLLRGRPDLAAIAARWPYRPPRDAVWLTPPAPPGDTFP